MLKGVSLFEHCSKRDLKAIAATADEIGAVAALRQVDVVPALPKTRSGKVLRRTMRDIADGGPGVPPSTIDDPAVLEALRPILTRNR